MATRKKKEEIHEEVATIIPEDGEVKEAILPDDPDTSVDRSDKQESSTDSADTLLLLTETAGSFEDSEEYKRIDSDAAAPEIIECEPEITEPPASDEPKLSISKGSEESGAKVYIPETKSETESSAEATTREYSIEESPEDYAQPASDSLETVMTVRPEKQLSPAAQRRRAFFDLDLNKFDKDLTPEQVQEWNNIYASYRSKSILSGMVIGRDQNTFEVSGENGETEVKSISSLIIIDYRVKVLIPETELWISGAERPAFVMNGMVGGIADFIILEVDREGECAIGSRRMALMSKRYFFNRNEHKSGEKLTCKVIAVGPKVCTVECNGFDILLTQRDLSWSAIPDLRDKYRPSMELSCILKKYDKDAGKLEISVKDAMLNPFEGADVRHPVGCRRQAVISGKYRGGVFCTLSDGTVCHCLYSSRHSDADFRNGDSVIIMIKEYNYSKQQIFGRILTKW